MMATGVNFNYWKNVALIQVWEAATMIHGYDPRARKFGYVPMTSERDALDLGDHQRMLAAAVLDDEIVAAVDDTGEVGPETYLKRSSLAAWARLHDFETLADGLEGHAQSSSLASNNTKSAAPRPKFSMTRASLVQHHKHQWTTIETDLKDASKNGLNAARVDIDSRGWDEDLALDWARAKGKLTQPTSAGIRLTSALTDLPVTTHRMKR